MCWKEERKDCAKIGDDNVKVSLVFLWYSMERMPCQCVIVPVSCGER